MSAPFVYLACPQHSRTIDIGAALGMLALASRGEGGIKVFPRAHKSSVAPQAFNHLLAEACHLRDERGVTHFAMIHSDVEPEPYWLDKMLSIMTERQADVVSAVVAIKDRHGLTSTGGIGRSDPSRLTRRLTLTEAHQLPETFDGRELPWPDHRLVVNTGLMLCDLRRPWFEPDDDARLPVRFRYESEIVYRDGRYYANAEPEDWLFSQDVENAGGRLVATRGVAVSHWDGGTRYPNDAWGDWLTDQSYLDIKAKGSHVLGTAARWKFPGDVPGWLLESEGRALASLAAGKQVLEIGSYCGRSTICMAQTARGVYAVDTFDSRATGEVHETYQAFVANLNRYGLSDRVAAHRGLAADVVPGLATVGGFDLAFIDGAHDYASVRQDADLARSVLKPDGLLAFHDYRTAPGAVDGRWDPGVTRCVDELVGAGAENVGCYGTVAVLSVRRLGRPV